MTTFRPYQLDAQQAVRDAWDLALPGDPHPMLVCCTGSGKTEIALGLVLDAVRDGQRVVWLAHREELVVEPSQRLARGWPDIGLRAGIVQADRDDFDRQIVFASTPTLAVAERLERLLAAGAVDLVVVDEAHHSPSRSHAAVIERLLEGGARAVALTATPDREDNLDLGQFWEICFSYGILDAIADGWLVPPYSVVHRLPDLDLSKVSGRRDYDDAELGAALLAARVVEHTVEAMSQAHLAVRLPDREATLELEASGRGTLVFTATIEQAHLTAEALRAAGWRAHPISGETPRDQRRRLLRSFREGEIDVLCNAAVLTEGTDLPRASCLVFARPTRSWSLYTQMIGRGLRLHGLPKTHPGNNAHHPDYKAAGGKSECLVIDLAGATEEHSLVSAPVLIGGSRCPSSPNGAHAFEEAPDEVGGICVHCERRVRCLRAALAGGPGSHEWDRDGLCKHCEEKQCPESPNNKHLWIPDFDGEKPRRMCMYCPATTSDPLGSMVGTQKKAPDEVAPAAWLRLRDLEPVTCAVHLEEHGSLFVVEDDAPDAFRPYWIPRRGRRARPITPGPVPGDQVRALVDDIVRRAARVRDPRNPQVELHGALGRGVRDELTQRAVRLGIARLVTGSAR